MRVSSRGHAGGTGRVGQAVVDASLDAANEGDSAMCRVEHRVCDRVPEGWMCHSRVIGTITVEGALDVSPEGDEAAAPIHVGQPEPDPVPPTQPVPVPVRPADARAGVGCLPHKDQRVPRGVDHRRAGATRAPAPVSAPAPTPPDRSRHPRPSRLPPGSCTRPAPAPSRPRPPSLHPSRSRPPNRHPLRSDARPCTRPAPTPAPAPAPAPAPPPAPDPAPEPEPEPVPVPAPEPTPTPAQSTYDGRFGEPQAFWADSYSANGVCYPSTSGDHGVYDLMVDTPTGRTTVREAVQRLEVGRASDRRMRSTTTCAAAAVPPTMSATRSRACARAGSIKGGRAAPPSDRTGGRALTVYPRRGPIRSHELPHGSVHTATVP